MNSLKKMSLMSLVLLGLAGFGCGDDDGDGDGNGNGADAGTPDAGGDGDGDAGGDGDGDGTANLDVSCLAGGSYEGFKGTDIKEGAADEGACITDVQLAQICTTNPSGVAGEAGTDCYLGGKTGEALRTCVVDGDSGLGVEGLRASADDLSDACLGCYADTVACAAENCAAVCAGAAESEACVTCREENECQSTFYSCSGLPVPEEL